MLDLRDFPGDPVEKKLVHDYQVILEDPEIQVVVETMGGLKPAYDFSKQALLAGKSVCTSNKELVARHGMELMEIAREKNVNYLYEASCGGGIPIIRPLNTCLTADVIDEISGILNGTTNYILTKMESDGTDFETALREAQAKDMRREIPRRMWRAMTPAARLPFFPLWPSEARWDYQGHLYGGNHKDHSRGY